MIVKIQTKSQIENKTKYGWVFYDCVEHIEIRQEERQQEENIDCPTYSLLMTDDSKTVGHLYMVQMFPGGSRESLTLKVDYNEVYLLNNEGKTIERIN